MNISKEVILIIVLLFHFSENYIFAQFTHIKGSIKNIDTDESIPNINIFLKDAHVGTISNQSGSFSINLLSKYSNTYLYFTGIGYQKDSILIHTIQSPITIKLQPEIYRLTEVYVMPDSTLLTLLHRAYSKIPENYPTISTMYEGFYRESTQNDQKEQADFIEAILSIYKDPYNKPSSNPGQIKILKSRKKRIHDTGVLYYGGPSSTIRKDVVLSRADFITPRNFKNYLYTFDGIKVIGNREFYEISFTKMVKDTTHQNGTMLIDKENLAYGSFDISQHLEYPLHLHIKKRKTNEKISYEKYDGKWFLKYYTYEHDDFIRFSNKVVHGSIDYVTTYIKTDSIKPIPYEQQLHILDPLVIKAEEYNIKGWTDYDILRNIETGQTNFQFSEDESAEIFIQNKSRKSVSEGLSQIRPFLLHFYFDWGISYKPVSISSLNHHFSFQPNTDMQPFVIDKKQKKKSESILIQSSIGYRFNKNMYLFYQGSSDYFNKSISSNEHYIGAGYQKNIKPTGRPLLLQSSLMLAFKSYYTNLGKYENPSTFHYKGVKVDASKISFDYGKQQKIITPQIALMRSMSRFFSLKMYLGYNINLHNKNVFRIKEEKGNIFTKKKVTISADDPDLQFGDNTTNIWDSFTIHSWQAGISLVFN